MFAAAGIYALDHVTPRLSWDHTHARAIAQSKLYYVNVLHDYE